MTIFKKDECTTLKMDEKAIFKIDLGHFDLEISRKSNPKETNLLLFNYCVREFTDEKYSRKYIAAVLGNDLPDDIRLFKNHLKKSWNENDNCNFTYWKIFFIVNSTISETGFTLSDGTYGRNDAMFKMRNTAFGKMLEHHLNRISEKIEKIMQTEQKALYEDLTLRYQENNIIGLNPIFRTHEKKIDQKMHISKLIAKVRKKLDKVIKAGQKVSEALIIDMYNKIKDDVLGIIEASNSFVDISNGLVNDIIEELKTVRLTHYNRSLPNDASDVCTDDHIGPERHKSKNTTLKRNEHMQHVSVDVFDLVDEIRKRSKSFLEVVSRITPTLLQLGLQMLKRSSYLWMSDNNLILQKSMEITDYGLDLQCPLQSNSYMKRMSTFKSNNNAKGVIWNEETIVKPEQLVGAGFSFDGKQDHVRCTSCECTSDVSQWNRNDEEYAISIHKGLAKDCKFVRTYGGSCTPEYVLPN